jgi:hypothetical protein
MVGLKIDTSRILPAAVSPNSHTRGLYLYHPAGNSLLQSLSMCRLTYDNHLKRNFSTKYHLGFHISNSSIFPFLQKIQQLLTSCSSPSRHWYHCFYLSFNNVFQKAVPNKMWPSQLAFFRFLLYRIFLSSLTLCNTSLFLTRSVQLKSILLQDHILKRSRYFWSIFRSAQPAAPQTAMHKI